MATKNAVAKISERARKQKKKIAIAMLKKQGKVDIRSTKKKVAARVKAKKRQGK